MLTQRASSAPAPTQQDVERALETNKALDKVARLRPSLDDYVSEGVLPYKPEGKFSIPVDGRRVLQMNEDANRLAGWYGDNNADDPRRRSLREARAEKKARKCFTVPIRSVVGSGIVGTQYRCEHGHTFSFLARSDRPRTKKCVRDGCPGTGVLETA